MKKFKLSVFLISAVFYSWSQTNTFPTSGDVGIGTTSPQGKLHVKTGSLTNQHYISEAVIFEGGTEGRVQILSGDNDNAAAMLLLTNIPAAGGNNKHWNIHHAGLLRNDRLEIGYGTSTSSGTSIWNVDPKLVIQTDGNVGIGTSTPSTLLDLRGGDMTIYQNELIFQDFNNGASDGMGMGYLSAGNMKIYSDALIHFQESDSDDTKFLMDLNSGRFAINGSSLPSGYKLSVKGKAIMEEVQVQVSSSWPDYVFSDGYDLISLTHLKEFISINKHLPKIPTDTEVEKEGIALGEMNALLLEKIEELTLYQIQLMERLEKLESDNSEMMNEIITLKSNHQ